MYLSAPKLDVGPSLDPRHELNGNSALVFWNRIQATSQVDRDVPRAMHPLLSKCSGM